jgi:hypothetical protein
MCKNLRLTRVDLLKDDYEGSVTRGIVERWKDSPNAAILSRMRPELKKQTYVSCWHANNDESEAMWRLYCGASEGIALQTSYQTLDESLPPGPGVYIGQVTYINYETSDELPDANALSPFMFKRLAFAHEREVRVVAWPPGMGRLRLLQPGETPPPPSERRTIDLEWNISKAIEHVYVSPYASAWYRDVAAAVLEKFAPALVDRLRWSEMKGVPRF